LKDKIILKKLILLTLLAIVLFLSWYFLVLILRTSFLESPTYVGSDVIIGFHSISALTFILIFIALNSDFGFKKVLTLAFVCVLFIEIAFIALNINGKISVYKKNELLIKQKQIQKSIHHPY